MAASKKKPAIIPSIKPAQDEVASYQRSGRSDAPSKSNFNALLVFIILLMVILMGIGGYTLYEVQKKLKYSNELLTQGQESIQQLESRLSATGTDVSKTLLDVKSQVATNFTEIDKLWAIAFRENKPDIQKNIRTLAALEKKLGTQQQSLINEVSGLKQVLLEDSEDVITQTALLRGQVQDMAVNLEASTRNLNLLTRKMAETQAAIEAIDQHRQQVNQKLIELESRP